MNRLVWGLAVGAWASLACTGAAAHEAGEWLGRVGFHYVDPKADNHEIVRVDGAGAVTAGMTYFVAPVLAVDLLVALPFEHDVELDASGGKVAEVRHLPPTLSLAWYPDLDFPVKPFLGVGVNYTLFFEEKTRGALDGARLHLEDSIGLAFMAGVEYALADRVWLLIDVRHMDIDSEAELDGESLGDVHIDPWAYGMSLAYRF